LNPEKQPEYRQQRSHLDFLTTLRARHLAFAAATSAVVDGGDNGDSDGIDSNRGVTAGGVSGGGAAAAAAAVATAAVAAAGGGAGGGGGDAAPFWHAVEAAAAIAFEVYKHEYFMLNFCALDASTQLGLAFVTPFSFLQVSLSFPLLIHCGFFASFL
jgi:hypothetical protein